MDKMDQIIITDGFRQNIEEMQEYAEKYDRELFDAMQWLDKLAQSEGISFFEKCYEVLYRHDIKKKAREWLEKKNESN